MHHKCIHFSSEPLMLKSLWKGPHNRKSKALPKADRAQVSADDKVELHRSKTCLTGPLDGVLCQRATYAVARFSRGHHESSIGHMIPESRLILLYERSAHDCAIHLVDRHENTCRWW